MTPSLRQWLAAVVTLCCTAGALAQSRPVVVEPFTSEGCSSYPPAEAYIGQLGARSDVFPLADTVGADARAISKALSEHRDSGAPVDDKLGADFGHRCSQPFGQAPIIGAAAHALH